MRIKLHRIAILGIAALAGTGVYKLQKGFTTPGTNTAPGQSLYSSVTGPGSLVQTIRTSNDGRTPHESNGTGSYHAPNGTGYVGSLGGSTPRRGNSILSNGSQKDEGTPDDFELIQAAAKGDKSWVERRLSFHVKVDSRDNLRRTPLMYAAWSGYDNICNRLIAAGANPLFQDRQGNNAFDYAAGRGLTDTLHFLLKRTQMKDDGNYMEYARIIQAAFSGDPARMPEGNGKLASINRINPEGHAPMHIVAGNGAIALMDVLIKRGANVNIANSDRQTPLHWAAWNNQTQAVKFLIEKGADLSATDLAGNTPLILAAQNGSSDSASILLAKGADKYISNKNGKTASIVAEDSGFAALANALK